MAPASYGSAKIEVHSLALTLLRCSTVWGPAWVRAQVGLVQSKRPKRLREARPGSPCGASGSSQPATGGVPVKG